MMAQEMKLTRTQIEMLNNLAQTNLEKAQGMLDGMNEILGTRYGWLAKEVVWFEDPDKGYGGGVHSAIAWAE